MQPPDITSDADRLAALDRYAILDTPAEPGFDDIVQLAALLCEAPVALVSLVASDRQWFKARIGFDGCETDLSRSVCAHALIEPDLLIIPDLTQDPRTRANPLVTGAPNIRFYAGAPIRAPGGEVLGSLCVIDADPRPNGLSAAQAAGLRTLSRQVTNQLELRLAVLDRDALLAEQQQAAARRNGLIQLGDSLREMTDIGEMTRIAAAIVGQTLQASRAGFGRLDAPARTIVVEPDWTIDGVASIAGRHPLDDYGHLWDELLTGAPLVIADVADDPRTAAQAGALRALDIAALVNMPVREHGRTVAVFIVHDRQPRQWAPEALAFLRNVADRLEAALARLDAESQQHMLNEELNHRFKNTFAMIQAIAMQTLRAVPDQQPVDAFIQRLHALSAAHSALLQKHWASASFRPIVGNVIATLTEPERFDLAGPEVEIGPRASLSVSLLLHELTTNALKYGALSNTQGRVSIAWQIDGPDDKAQFSLGWREAGGPPAQPPRHRGFGSRLIRMGLVGTGGVQMDYSPSGLHAEFRAPLYQLQLS